MMKFVLIAAFAVTCSSLPQSYKAPSLLGSAGSAGGHFSSGRGGFSSGGGGHRGPSSEFSSFGGGRGGSVEYGSSSGGFGSLSGHGGLSGGFSGYGGSSGGFGGSSGGYRGSGPVVPILVDNREGPIDGTYKFEYETGDGANRKEEGVPNGPYGSVVQQGGWSFTFPDGTPGEFSFVADENGYRVKSPLLPVGPPLPTHALAQIEKAARERAQGIVHGGGYSDDSYERSFGGQSLHGGQQKSHGGQRGGSYVGNQRGFQGGQGFQGQPQRPSQIYNF